MYQGPIIDSHHHLWEVKNYPWLSGPSHPTIFAETYEPLRKDYLLDDLLADFGDNNVVKSVHMQANYLPHDPVGETRWLQSIADRHGFPHAITGRATLAADDVADVIAGHCAFANFRAVRDRVFYEPSKSAWQAVDRPDFVLGAEFRRGLAVLSSHGIHCELQGFANQFVHFAELIGDHPDIQFALVHAGLLTGDDDDTFSAWEHAMERFVGLPNFFVKCSGVNNANWGPPRSPAAVARQYNTLADMFGAEHCFFGSNFPVEELKSSYDGLIDMLKKALGHRTETEQHLFFHDTAARFYRI